MNNRKNSFEPRSPSVETLLKDIEDQFNREEPQYGFIRDNLENFIKVLLKRESNLEYVFEEFVGSVGKYFSNDEAEGRAKRKGVFSCQISYLKSKPEFKRQSEIASSINSFLDSELVTVNGNLSKIKKAGSGSLDTYMNYLFALLVAGVNRRRLQPVKRKIWLLLLILTLSAAVLTLLFQPLLFRGNDCIQSLIMEEKEKSIIFSYSLVREEVAIIEALDTLSQATEVNLNVWVEGEKYIYEVATTKEGELPEDALNTFPIGKGSVIEVSMRYRGRLILYDHIQEKSFGLDFTKNVVEAIQPQPDVKWFDKELNDRFKKFTVCYSPVEETYGVCVNLEYAADKVFKEFTSEDILLLLREGVIKITDNDFFEYTLGLKSISLTKYRKTISKELYEDFTEN